MTCIYLCLCLCLCLVSSSFWSNVTRPQVSRSLSVFVFGWRQNLIKMTSSLFFSLKKVNCDQHFCLLIKLVICFTFLKREIEKVFFGNVEGIEWIFWKEFLSSQWETSLERHTNKLSEQNWAKHIWFITEHGKWLQILLLH